MAGPEIVTGAIVGLAFQQLYVAIIEAKERCKNFKSTLESLENRINLLTPKIREMDRLNQVLGEGDYPKQEILLFLQQLRKARELVSMCSQLTKRHFLKKIGYAKRLDELDSSLEKLLNVEFQAAQALEVKRLMVEVVNMNKKLDGIYLPGHNHNPSDGSSSSACFDMHFKWKNKKFDFHLGFGT